MHFLVICLWLGIIVTGILAMQWGVRRVCSNLAGFRSHWGLTETAAGALVGLATSAPEISVNVASVALGWPDIGLGTALGSNVPALPLIFIVTYLTTRWRGRKEVGDRSGGPAGAGARVKPQAAGLQILPYAFTIGLLAILTLTPGQEGLQPIDAAVLLGACTLYLTQAILRGRHGGAEGAFPWDALIRTVPGFMVISIGALVSVVASRRLNATLGIPDFVGGLFVTGFLCALPEAFGAWRLTRAGHATSAVSGAVADGIYSLSLAMIPLALVGSRVGDVGLFTLNLGFIAAVLLAYAAMTRERQGNMLTGARVALFQMGYAGYLGLTIWYLF